MIEEIEKTFFDTFGIEPRHKCKDGALEPCNEQCNECGYYELRYPQITDRILLELICILTKRFDYADQNWLTKCNDTKELKVSVLRLLLLCSTSIIEKYKHQVHTLFEEE